MIPLPKSALAQQLREQLVAHISTLGLQQFSSNGILHNGDKELVRAIHAAHRAEFLQRERSALRDKTARLVQCFAEGREISPEKIDPEIVPVEADKESGQLFRLATTLWSVPVSRGYGRRMRFLILDRSNHKLIGILALGDPVFNLKVRDEWIGWNAEDRRRRLVNVMDAYVVGAVPPYSQILGGKLVACLLGCKEVATEFHRRYADRVGIISGKRKRPKLVLVTVTSALGRSSIYNRLKLPGLVELVRIGASNGWGHFHVPQEIFGNMRKLLEMDGHPYARGYEFGQGPNWRIRVIRQALENIGMDGALLQHGIIREVFAMPLAENWREYLQGKAKQCRAIWASTSTIVQACLERWVIPRAFRQPEFRSWTVDDTKRLFESIL